MLNNAFFCPLRRLSPMHCPSSLVCKFYEVRMAAIRYQHLENRLSFDGKIIICSVKLIAVLHSMQIIFYLNRVLRSLNQRGAGVSSQPSLGWGGGGWRISPPMSNLGTTRPSAKPEAAIESSQRGHSNAVLNLLSKVKCWVMVEPKVKADSFRLTGCRDQTRDRC